MHNLCRNTVCLLLLAVVAISCTKNAKETVTQQPIPRDVLNKIYAMGLGNKNVQRHAEGYLVEGDIIVTEDNLRERPYQQSLRAPNGEHYRATYLVTGLPRVITVRVNSSLPTKYVSATDIALTRYNALGLRISFARVTTGGNIVINPGAAGATYQVSAGFPTSTGNPYNTVLVNRPLLDTWNNNTVATLIAHGLGHCIGFHHTDVLDPEYSCGVGYGSPPPIPPMHIFGTPTGPVAGSWMLTCISNGQNRPFVTSDIAALNYLY